MFVQALIVDDNQEIRNTLSLILENVGYSVETAENGKKAIELCKKTSFDVALIDVILPDVKGTDLLPILKEIQPKMIKIIITGQPSIENAAKSVNEKADGYVIKPFDPEKLVEIIDRLIKEKQNEYFHMFNEVERAKRLRRFSDIKAQKNGRSACQKAIAPQEASKFPFSASSSHPRTLFLNNQQTKKEGSLFFKVRINAAHKF